MNTAASSRKEREPQEEQPSQADVIITGKKMDGKWPLSRILYFFSTLDAFTEEIKKKKRKAINLSFLFGFLAIACLIASKAASIDLLAVLAAMIGIVFAVELITVFYYKKISLQEEFIDFTGVLLKHLRDDCKRGSLVSLSLYLNPLDEKMHLTGQSGKYAKGAYYRCVDYTYDRVTLSLGLRLKDGNRLSLSGREILVKTRMRKKNQRGKIKFKTREKKKMVMTVKIMADGERFTVSDVPESTEGRKFYLEEGQKGITVGVRYVERSREKLPPDPLAALRMAATLYGLMRPVPPAS